MNVHELINTPIAQLVPHAKPMLLLERVVAVSANEFETELTIRADSLFCEEGKVGAWVGIEYMAQTVAAFAGAEGVLEGRGIKLGFLVATREYQAHVPYFELAATLRVRAKKLLLNAVQNLSVLECTICHQSSGETLAKANLTVYQVEDFQAYLAERKR